MSPAHRRIRWWATALALTLALTGYLTVRLVWADRSLFSPGAMSDGHYQIEIACEACHTPFGGVKQEACLGCHAAELEAANDSHPKKKFDDPRNADRLQTLDARRCVVCHTEHRPQATRAMGVSLPDDFCAHCHAEVGEERPSHRDFAFTGCAGAGCHNYHDNTALYEDFLVKHNNGPSTRPEGRVALRELGPWLAAADLAPKRPLAASAHDAPAERASEAVIADWAASTHAGAGVNCGECHGGTGTPDSWREKPDITVCARCHEAEKNGFAAGRHGMRSNHGLTPMRVGEARRPMQSDAAGRELGCNSCHGAHADDTRRAAVEACLGCHDDDHTRAYRASPHFQLWQAEGRGERPAGAGVSCATCHLPREHHKTAAVEGVRVQHNQNANLRPNEKMIRGVCLSCHSLGFSIDALADPALVRSNFAGRPSRHISSINLAIERIPKSLPSQPARRVP